MTAPATGPADRPGGRAESSGVSGRAGAVRLLGGSLLVAVLLVALTAVSVVTRQETRAASATASAARVAVETLAAVEELGCDQISDRHRSARCQLIRSAAAPEQSAADVQRSDVMLGAVWDHGSRDGRPFRVRVNTASSLSCPAGPRVVTAEAGGNPVVRRTATVHLGGHTAFADITSPVEALVLVPAAPGTSVRVTSIDGTVTQSVAASTGCAAFPADRGTHARFEDGTAVTVGADGTS